MSVKEWIILAVSVKKSQRNWLSFEPLRLYPENVALCKSFSCWQAMHNRTPRHGFTPRFRDRIAARFAFIATFAVGKFAASAGNGIFNGIVDLFIHWRRHLPSRMPSRSPDFRVPEVKCSAVRRKNRIARPFQTMSRANVIQRADQTSEAGNSRWYIYPVALYGYLTPLLKGECHVRPETGVTPAQPPSTPL
ncbi:Uncharacterised protein [Salmonella enterica subsp. enterica]|nr:Uncharacterised protein [Salmonella enterica subsp. enterica]